MLRDHAARAKRENDLAWPGGIFFTSRSLISFSIHVPYGNPLAATHVMAYWAFSLLAPHWAAWEKITFRAALAAIVSFALAMLIGRRLIAWLERRFREPIKCDSPAVAELHRHKNATPTMGGLFIVAGWIATTLALADLANPVVAVALFAVASLAVVGAIDDWTKLFGAGAGMRARTKLFWQTVIALVASLAIYRLHLDAPGALSLTLPFASTDATLGWWFVPLATATIVGSSNAVNLTDGLDGLAGGCLTLAAAAIGAAVYVAGHAEWAAYLNVPHIPLAGEATVVAAAMIGAVLGFLWFNCHPAQVFMGDCGSLPLGGLLGLLAVVCRQEFLLAIVGGVFVVEAASVILQVGYFRWRGRRLFRCAPLHHHFQLLGWPESRIVVRFWIAAAICAAIGLAGLKLRIDDRPIAAPHSAIVEHDVRVDAPRESRIEKRSDAR